MGRDLAHALHPDCSGINLNGYQGQNMAVPLLITASTGIGKHADSCRLLRNRVSAQQARERKKSYVSTIEEKVSEQDQQLAQYKQHVQKLERENGMLRQVIKNIKGSNRDAMLVPSANAHPDAVQVPVLRES